MIGTWNLIRKVLDFQRLAFVLSVIATLFGMICIAETGRGINTAGIRQANWDGI